MLEAHCFIFIEKIMQDRLGLTSSNGWTVGP